MEIHPDKVCYVIARFRELEEEDLIEAADEEPDRDFDIDHEEAFEQLESHATEDPIREELAGFIANLTEDEQIELVALSWLGRGDYEVDNWGEAVEAAAERHNMRTADYLLGMPQLADYLEEAITRFGHSCTDFDVTRM